MDAGSNNDDCDDNAAPRRGRKHERTWSRSSSRRHHPSASTSPTSSARKHLKTAAFRNGISSASGKPKASDYEDIVKRRLLKAMSVYETYIYTTYAYPSQENQTGWVHKAWDSAGENAMEKYDLTHMMIRLVCFFLLQFISLYLTISSQIKDRGPRARGYLKDVTRPHIEKAYRFTPSTSKKGIQRNRNRYHELMEDRSFHYKVHAAHIHYDGTMLTSY
jgi:Domain of unknown function (DUF6532)